jgi:HD-GYP domain-containing protein (c-di-GMP phosphodiesterase class II)
MGLALETGLQVCRIAVALAHEAGLAPDELERVYWVALLRHVGCTADVHNFAELVGDDVAFRSSVGPLDATTPRALGPVVLRQIVRTHGMAGAAAKLLQMATARDRFEEGVRAVCEVAQQLADQLGLSESVQADLLMINERWDGKSFLKRASGEQVPVAVRVVQVADCAAMYCNLGGAEAAKSVVRDRAGGAFDPRFAALLAADAAGVLAPCETAWDAVLAQAPPEPPLDDAGADVALGAIAEFVDLKSPFTVGHSPGVARLAESAARVASLPADDAALLRRSGLIHDIGRVAISSRIWEKRGPLSRDEWESVRLHPYHGERVLSTSGALRPLAGVAAAHHERCDGSGYHRGTDARGLSQPARILAAADAFHAMTEPRPYRAAMSPEEAAAALRAQARAGCLDGDAVEWVVAGASGQRVRRREHVAGLTARELEVLRLLARGRTIKEIASDLVITPKTADSHVQHVYRKIGVSTRAAATVFAMRHDLVGESSGEHPM